MFRHMLVPLDGSRLAEAVLPLVATLARRLPARVTLLHVVEPEAPPTVHGDVHLRQAAEAEAYLQGAAGWLAGQGVDAGIAVDQGGDIAGVIARRAAQAEADLIVLCTHGRGGFRAFLSGRVAQQVLARGTIPVMLLPPDAGRREEPFLCRRILVPLDGSPMAEAALQPAALLARVFEADLLLVMVVPTLGTLTDDRAGAAKLMPTAGVALLEVEAREGLSYLDGVVSRLAGEGIAAARRVDRGEPVRMLLEVLGQREADLTVMATHGRSGVSAVWAGSVASRLVEHTPRPLLLIRIPRES